VSEHELEELRKRVQAKLTLLYKRLNPQSTVGVAMYRLSMDEALFLRFAILAVMNANDEHPKHTNEECLSNAIQYADMLNYDE
jgi:hypothetical protein